MKGINVKTIIQAAGSNFDITNVVIDAKEVWKLKGKKIKDITSIDVYFNANESVAYCVFNANETIKVEV